jgi:hypothetical protein
VLENDAKGRSRTGISFPIPLDFGGKRTEQRKAKDNNDNADDATYELISEILVIRRNLDAGFPGNIEKPELE